MRRSAAAAQFDAMLDGFGNVGLGGAYRIRSSSPLARFAARLLDSVQPVPWVFFVAMRLPGNHVSMLPSKSKSSAVSLK